jgi:ribosomal protein S18 acetylase RimI-like enzyme
MPGVLCCYEFNILRIAKIGNPLNRIGDTEAVTFRPVADNLRESFRIIASSRGGEVRELPGVSIASASVTFQMFNAAFLSTPIATEDDLTQRILVPSLHFQVRGHEWAYWVCEDWIDPKLRRRSRRVLENHGLRHSTDLPGMTADSILPPVRPLPRIEVRRVHDRATRDAFCGIGSACFHVPIEWFREVFVNDSVWERFASYVGYVNGEPVSTAAIVKGGGVTGVYNVATLHGSQRRGYGEAVMRQALAENGNGPVVLQSTSAGLRLYERMGFRTVTRIAVYAS